MSGTYTPIETGFLNHSQRWNSGTIEATSRILDMERYNGRISDLKKTVKIITHPL